MTDTPPVSTPPGLVDRAKAILLKPKEEYHEQTSLNIEGIVNIYTYSKWIPKP